MASCPKTIEFNSGIHKKMHPSTPYSVCIYLFTVC